MYVLETTYVDRIVTGDSPRTNVKVKQYRCLKTWRGALLVVLGNLNSPCISAWWLNNVFIRTLLNFRGILLTMTLLQVNRIGYDTMHMGHLSIIINLLSDSAPRNSTLTRNRHFYLVTGTIT